MSGWQDDHLPSRLCFLAQVTSDRRQTCVQYLWLTCLLKSLCKEELNPGTLSPPAESNPANSCGPGSAWWPLIGTQTYRSDEWKKGCSFASTTDGRAGPSNQYPSPCTAWRCVPSVGSANRQSGLHFCPRHFLGQERAWCLARDRDERKASTMSSVDTCVL